MCGRYTLNFTIQGVAKFYGIEKVNQKFQGSYNIAPQQEVPIIFYDDGQLTIDTFRWGLVPHWAKEEKIGYKMINARAESVSEKPAYRTAFAHNRCLIPASGFYEWQKKGDNKIPYYIRIKDKEIFSFAGLYSIWKSPTGIPLKTCTIITTSPNEYLGKIHDRMPVVLPKKEEMDWISDSKDKEMLKSLLKNFHENEFEAYPVSDLVNSPKNNSKEPIAKF